MNLTCETKIYDGQYTDNIVENLEYVVNKDI